MPYRGRRRFKPLIGRNRATANMSTPKFKRMRTRKLSKRYMRKRKAPNTGTAVHGKARVYLGSLNPTVNINNPANTTQTTAFQVFNVRPSLVDELTARSTIYSKFRIRKVKYTFIRDKLKESQSIATAEFRNGNFAYCFPNQFNRLLPTITTTNFGAVQLWCDQQTGVKRIPINRDKFTMTLTPKLTRAIDYAGPSNTTAGTFASVQNLVKCPWMDLNNDLLDELSLGQVQCLYPALNVTTTLPVATAAGAVGPQASDINNIFTYKVYADVFYSVKGRWLDKTIV